jgi:hypothetical protein
MDDYSNILVEKRKTLKPPHDYPKNEDFKKFKEIK